MTVVHVEGAHRGEWRVHNKRSAVVLGKASGRDMAKKWHPLLIGSALAWLDPVITRMEVCQDLSKSYVMGHPCRRGDQDLVIVHITSLQVAQYFLDTTLY